MKQRCRCCLATNAEMYVDIFEQHKSGATYAENIRYLAEVQVEHDDGLPQQICSSCCNELNQIYEFGISVRLSDEKLRQELIASNKNRMEEEDEVQMENVQVLENEYFSPVDENGIQVCVIEEILEQETEREDVIVEEIHEVEELNMMEELLDVGKEPKENLLASLAQVASTQENVNITISASNELSYFPEDELDDNYLIKFNEHEVNSYKPPKWKCGECQLILRGDVSYEGHMNMHKQLRPHQCPDCQTKFRCRTALKRHKELRHSKTLSKEDIKITYTCRDCNNSFLTSPIFKLHQIIVHNQGQTCPFACDLIKGRDNIKDHLEQMHAEQLATLAEIFLTNGTLPIYQCFKCSETYEKQTLLENHIKLCQSENENEQLQEDILSVETDENMEESPDLFQCKICRRKLLKKNLNKHMELHKRKESRTQDETRKFLCAFCPREFKNGKSLHQHEKIHQGERLDIVYACSDCDRQYASQYLLDTHRKHAHKERDNICNICGNAFKMKNQLMNHMKLHLEKNIPCPHCDKKYARHFDLNVHLRSHTGEMPYACHLCEKRFAIKVRLTYHLQKHYGIKHYCKECGAEFNSKQKLKAHSFKHTGMPYRCELCDDHGFATRNTFKRHLDRVHHATISDEALNEMFQQNTGKSVKIRQINHQSLVQTTSEDDNENIQEEIEVLGKYISFAKVDDLYKHISTEHYRLLHECPQCSESFSQLKLLQEHERKVHTIRRVYKCKICGNNFRGQAQLSAHKRLHKERPFKCDQCAKSYPRKVDLQIHMRTHTGELPYECHLCDKRFAIKVHLTYHLQKHEGIKHACTFCSAVYDNRNKLKAHLFKHTGMPYKCEICPGVGFERRIRFANHMQRVHHKTLSKEELAEIFAKNTGKTVHFKQPGS